MVNLEQSEEKHFATVIANELNVRNMMKDLEVFNKLERYTGSSDGEKAVDFIVDRMKALDIHVSREFYDIYRSLPLESNIEILSGAPARKYHLTPYVYSGVASNIRAPLIYDKFSENIKCPQNLMSVRMANVEGKIVLTYDNSYKFACLAKQAGAVGILTIWRANLAHHGTLGGVWGAPEPDDLQYRYPFIPYAEIVKNDGEELKKFLNENEVIVSLNVSMNNSIMKTSMPIATIKGESDNFVLVSGHYDSWYEGITDNAVANVSMMELARVLRKHQQELKRTVILAWWSGHSDGRYSGSTWYYDHHWHELKEHCVAHINMDICGCKTSDLVSFNTSMLEGEKFSEEFLKEFNAERPISSIPMARFADQSFWGADVPLAIMPKFSRKTFPSEQTFYWWHSVEDTIDKVDPKIVLRDSRVIAKLTCIFANVEKLPIDLLGFTDLMEKRLRLIEANLSRDFDLSDIWIYISKLKSIIKIFSKEANKHLNTDNILTSIAGELARITFTSSSPYHQDLAVNSSMFPKLSEAVGQTPENTTPDYYLALKTMFYRQKNRLTGQIDTVIEKCENQLFRWKTEKNE